MVSKPKRTSLSTSRDHVDVMPSGSDGKKKGNIRLPCRLCEGEHLVHLCPLMDEVSNVLENHAAPQLQLLVGYQRLSSNPLPVGQEIDLGSSLVCLALLERDSLVFVPDQPLVEKSVDFFCHQLLSVFEMRMVIILVMFFLSAQILMN